jgi:hypothetical protein
MSRPDEEDTFSLGLDGEDEYDDEDWDEYTDAPGPDERDRDLMDGSWEQKYYSGRLRSMDWNSILVAIALLALAGLIVPTILVVL